MLKTCKIECVMNNLHDFELVDEVSSNNIPVSEKHEVVTFLDSNLKKLAALSLILVPFIPSKVSARNIDVLESDAITSSLNTNYTQNRIEDENLNRIIEINTDEYRIEFNGTNLGLKLLENFYKGFPIVIVKEIKDPYLLQSKPELQSGAIVVAVGDESVDGIPLKKIAELIRNAPRPFTIKFRDPDRFLKQLDSTQGAPLRVVRSSYLPANTRDAGAPAQVITVERLELPPPEQRIRAAQMLDVLEIQYVAQIAGDTTGKIVDGSSEKAPPGSSTKSIYYVLGQQNGPPGKYPPGWDFTLTGMVVGEKRRITLPYTLAYDRKGYKENNIPPYASLIYTVRLISLT